MIRKNDLVRIGDTRGEDAVIMLPTPVTWDAPPIPCWYCGRGVTPVRRLSGDGSLFWAMPGHFPYIEVASSPCGGSGRLIGPVIP